MSDSPSREAPQSTYRALDTTRAAEGLRATLAELDAQRERLTVERDALRQDARLHRDRYLTVVVVVCIVVAAVGVARALSRPVAVYGSEPPPGW